MITRSLFGVGTSDDAPNELIPQIPFHLFLSEL